MLLMTRANFSETKDLNENPTRSTQGSHSPYIPGDTTRPIHITYVLVWWKSDQRRLRKTIHKQTDKPTDTTTSGYATMVHGRGCNVHRCTTTFANEEITSSWRHWWRHNSETIRARQKRRPHRAMQSSELSNGENLIALRQLLQNRKLRHLWRHNLGSRWKLQKNGSKEF